MRKENGHDEESRGTIIEDDMRKRKGRKGYSGSGRGEGLRKGRAEERDEGNYGKDNGKGRQRE